MNNKLCTAADETKFFPGRCQTMACAFTFVHHWISLHQSPSLSLWPRHRFSRISPSSPASGGALSHRRTRAATGVCCRRYGRSLGAGEDTICFERAVSLFNSGDYYRCHDCLEELWYEAEEPIRTILHGIIQCAVGFHHLFNQNHRGAMMELGAGLCKLRKVGFAGGPFLRFEQEMSAALEFVYQTQKELAACADDFCIALDGSEGSYQLLGSFAAGQKLYKVDTSPEGIPCIVFTWNFSDTYQMVKLPTLHATEEHLQACRYSI